MVAAPATYDLMIMLEAEAPEEARARVISEVERAITSGGSLVGRHDWGQRHTAYPIRHKPDAVYHLFQFHGPAELLDSLQRTLRITDGVVRFRLIKLDPGTPAPRDPRPETRPDPPAPARSEAGVGAAAPVVSETPVDGAEATEVVEGPAGGTGGPS